MTDEDEVLAAAAGHGIAMNGLRAGYIARPPVPGLLIGFGAVSTADLPAAMRLLGRVLSRS